jgi:hypothetical protein
MYKLEMARTAIEVIQQTEWMRQAAPLEHCAMSSRMVHAHIERMSSCMSCMCLVAMFCRIDLHTQRFGCGCSWPPCSPDMNLCVYFLWGYLKEKCVPHQFAHSSGVARGTKAVAEQITGDMLRDIADNSVTRLQ